jgi:hypothetical protein
MKVRDQLAALAQFDPDEELLPCTPRGMPIVADDDLAGPVDDGSLPRWFSDCWPSQPRDGDVVTERGKRFGQECVWRRERGQWVVQRPPLQQEQTGET